MSKIKTDDIHYFIDRSKELEESSPYQARLYLVIGKSLAPNNFYIQHQSYLLEKRLRNEALAARTFVLLFRKFMNSLDLEIREFASAVQTHHLNKGKETDEQIFLLKVFTSFPKDVQMEILMQRSDQTEVLIEKCQCMLLLVKLYPDILNQHGVKLLDSVLSCDTDAFSTFRKLLVKELVPAVLQLGENISASTPRLITLLNRCIEFYVLVPSESDSTCGNEDADNNSKRWSNLYTLVDQIGSILSWRISPFFDNSLQNLSAASVENLYQALYSALQQQNLYTVLELAYVAVVLFLRCVVTYNELAWCSTKFGERVRLELVEIFLPRPYHQAKPDPVLPVLITASHCSSVEGSQSGLLHYFVTASKIWEMFTAAKGDRIEKEFFGILYAMINLDNWNVFQSFLIDYRTYSGQYYGQDIHTLRHPLKLASFHCSAENLKTAVECAITAVQNIIQQENTNSTPVTSPSNENGSTLFSFNKPEDFGFFNEHIYNIDSKKNFVMQRRVHFLSHNRSEIIAYAANILIRSLHETIEIPLGTEDKCIGHLLTMLQLEWPSPPAELIFLRILEIIRRNGSFRYFPFFGDFILEPDFLEQFMAIANHEPHITLEFWAPTSVVATGSRRMATRGVDKGAKNEFRDSMTRQMMKNGTENLENIIVKFLTLNKVDILSCFR